jgi:hypothetical protein
MGRSEETWGSDRAKYPHNQSAIAKRLCNKLTTYGNEKGVPWELALHRLGPAFKCTHPKNEGQQRHGRAPIREKTIEWAVRFEGVNPPPDLYPPSRAHETRNGPNFGSGGSPHLMRFPTMSGSRSTSLTGANSASS